MCWSVIVVAVDGASADGDAIAEKRTEELQLRGPTEVKKFFN